MWYFYPQHRYYKVVPWTQNRKQIFINYSCLRKQITWKLARRNVVVRNHPLSISFIWICRTKLQNSPEVSSSVSYSFMTGVKLWFAHSIRYGLLKAIYDGNFITHKIQIIYLRVNRSGAKEKNIHHNVVIISVPASLSETEVVWELSELWWDCRFRKCSASPSLSGREWVTISLCNCSLGYKRPTHLKEMLKSE